jgi:hypothetical protein
LHLAREKHQARAELMQTGVINFDVISNQTLLAVILSEASYEQLQALMKDLTHAS